MTANRVWMLAALAMVAGCSSAEEGASDAGLQRDSGRVDASTSRADAGSGPDGASVDAGALGDAGARSDGGALDAGAGSDAGANRDTGGAPDASSAPDAWTNDSGSAAGDAGTPACTETVSSAAELEAAARRLGPGTVLCIAPGTYMLSARISLGAARSGTGVSPAVIRARDGLGTVTIDGGNHEEAFFLSGASFVVISGLSITGGQYHGIKIDAPSGDITISDCEIYDTFNGTDLGSQLSPIKGFQAPRVTIERTRIWFTRRWPGNNIQGIDCNACPDWVVRDNEIFEVRGMMGGTSGTAIQFKSGSSNTVIERNVLHDSFIGISFGGFGNPMGWSGQPWEHVGGIVRNNVIHGCEDAGITVLYARDGKIVHNTLWGNGVRPDVRRLAMNLLWRGNILDRTLNLRDMTGGGVTATDNLVLASPTDGSLFVSSAMRDFHLAATATIAIDALVEPPSDVLDDIDGQSRPRGPAIDLGADER